MKPLVIYHGNCYDGFTAAWVAWRRFGGDIDTHPAQYGQAPPEVLGRDVYVLDFSYPRDVMLHMDELSRSMLVLDHHKTAKEACDGLGFCEFDMDRSGAGMAWDHFFGGKPRPWLVDRVEDRDIWRFKYGDSTQRVHAALTSHPMCFETWGAISVSDLEAIEAQGSAILRAMNQSIAKASKHARVLELEVGATRLHCVALNVPYLNASETAHHLLEVYPDAELSITFFQIEDERWQYSLRSRKGGPDVSEIAKLYGGGGHANAAGFYADKLIV